MKSRCSCLLGYDREKVLSLGPVRKLRVGYGSYFRKSDSKHIKRWRCKLCYRIFSQATGSICFGQNKRRLNRKIFRLLVSGVSQRRTAIILKTNRKTVCRKLSFLGNQKKIEHEKNLERFKLSPSPVLYFDELETAEHSKWKPLSIALAVNQNRKILGFRVSSMPARGKDAFRARAKYGLRPDHRKRGVEDLLHSISKTIRKDAEIRSDEKTLYQPIVKTFFPAAKHLTFKGRRACVAGQGELKEGGHDPLFALNHTAAMMRANINRLFRRTWCLTKKPARLVDHIYLYLSFHNKILTPDPFAQDQHQRGAVLKNLTRPLLK